MAKKPDYIPRRNSLFDLWQKNYVSMVSTNAVAWVIPATEVTALTAAQGVYQPFYDAITDKKTATLSQKEAHRAQRKIYEKVLRDFNKSFTANNKNIPLQKKIELQITIPDTTRSKRVQVNDVVVSSVKSIGGGQIEFKCMRSNDATRSSLHPDADAVEVRYSIDVNPASWADCLNTFTSSKSKFTITLDPSAIGKRIYYFLRWIVKSDFAQERSLQ
jgi:hypothetical protein